jgi:hypothetical protein
MAWRALLEQHNLAVRREVSRCNGIEVTTTGDGFFARFDSPAQAVEAARAVRQVMTALDLEIRAGIHTGECEMEGTSLTGMAVHIASRIQAAAQPGEILVSSTLKDLAVGSTLRFIDRGEQQLKAYRTRGDSTPSPSRALAIGSATRAWRTLKWPGTELNRRHRDFRFGSDGSLGDRRVSLSACIGCAFDVSRPRTVTLGGPPDRPVCKPETTLVNGIDEPLPKFVEHRLGVDQIARVEALGEPGVHPSEAVARFGALALVAEQPRERHVAAEVPGPGEPCCCAIPPK